MNRVFTEMWALRTNGNFVKDDNGAYIMSSTKRGALRLAEERGKGETAHKCRLIIEKLKRI
jgi:hypothetical protein